MFYGLLHFIHLYIFVHPWRTSTLVHWIQVQAHDTVSQLESPSVQRPRTAGLRSARICCRGQLKCDGTRAEPRFRLSAKGARPLKSAGASVQSTTDSQVVHINGSNAGYTMFRGSVKSTGYPPHSQVSPSIPLPCVTMCHHISTGVYHSVLKVTFQLTVVYWRHYTPSTARLQTRTAVPTGSSQPAIYRSPTLRNPMQHSINLYLQDSLRYGTSYTRP